MENNETQICRNCGAVLPEQANFCHSCGQKNTTGKIAFREMVLEFFDALYSLDSRVFRTVRDIWIPGRLSRRYFEGRHKSYMHPVRLFLLISIIHFAVINYKVKDVVNAEMEKVEQKLADGITKEKFYKEIDTIGTEVKKEFDNPVATAAVDTLLERGRPDTNLTFNLNFFEFQIRDSSGAAKEFTLRQLHESSFEELVSKHHITGFWDRINLKQRMRFVQDPARFTNFLLANTIWVVLLMIPVIAFLMFLIYLRRKRYFVEHIVFLFHYHSFAFLLMSPVYALADRTPWLVAPAFLGLVVYLFIAMKNYYRQDFGKTFLKWCFVCFSYFFVFMIFAGLAFVVGFFLF